MKTRKPQAFKALTLRLPADLHKALTLATVKMDVYVGQFIEDLVRKQPEVRRELEQLGR